MYCVLETNLARKFAADLPLKIFLIVANLANNFQDLVAKVKNLVALAPVVGAISRPALGKNGEILNKKRGGGGGAGDTEVEDKGDYHLSLSGNFKKTSSGGVKTTSTDNVVH